MTRSTRRTRTRTLRVAGVGAAALLALSACSSSDSGSSPTSEHLGLLLAEALRHGDHIRATSLKESFTTLGKEFEKANPGAKVTYNSAAATRSPPASPGAPRPTCSPPPPRRWRS